MPTRDVAPAQDRLGVKVFLLLSGLLLLSASLHLLSPDRQENWKPSRLNSRLTYYYNADSSEYALLVARFPHGFVQHNMRLHRPLYPALGFLIYEPLRLLKPLLPPTLCRRASALMAGSGGDSVWGDLDVRDVLIAWVALILLNFILYLGALLLILVSLRRWFDPRLALVLVAFPAFHRNTIDFLLVPAADVFNLLLPAILLYALAVSWPARRSGAGAALALGTGMLGKPMLYVFCNWLYQHLVISDWRRGWRRALLCGLLFVAPLVLYAGFLLAVGVPLHCHEAAHDRQFVWMVDLFQQGRLLDIPWRWLVGFGTHARQVLGGWIVALAICALLACRKDRRVFALDVDVKKHLIIYVLAAAAFWVLGSVFSPRMSIYYCPAIVVLLGILADKKLARPHVFLAFGPLLQALEFVATNAFR